MVTESPMMGTGSMHFFRFRKQLEFDSSDEDANETPGEGPGTSSSGGRCIYRVVGLKRTTTLNGHSDYRF